MLLVNLKVMKQDQYQNETIRSVLNHIAAHVDENNSIYT